MKNSRYIISSAQVVRTNETPIFIIPGILAPLIIFLEIILEIAFTYRSVNVLLRILIMTKTVYRFYHFYNATQSLLYNFIAAPFGI